MGYYFNKKKYMEKKKSYNWTFLKKRLHKQKSTSFVIANI